MVTSVESNLRILIVLDSLGVGGTETHALALTHELLKQGVQVVLAAREGILSETFERLGCQIYHIDFELADNTSAAVQHKLLAQIRHILLQEKITVVHVHQIPSGRVAVQAAKEQDIPVVFTVHGTYYPPKVLSTILHDCTEVISVSPPVSAFLQKLGFPAKLIPNGINVHEFVSVPADDQRCALQIPVDAPVILYASRLSYGKSAICKMLLKACKNLQRRDVPNLHLIIAGNGIHFEGLRQDAERIQRAVKRKFIHFLGERTNMVNWYGLADCVVGTGRVALESMSCEKPVVAVGSHGFLGMVIPSKYEEAWNCYFGDHEATQRCSWYLLYQALQHAFAASNMLQELGREGRRWVERTFSIEQMTCTLVMLYRSLH